MRPRARRRLRALSVALALAALVVGALLWWRREGTALQSDVITRPAPEYGPTAQVLLPGLRGARVVVPDRPHAPEEVQAADRASRIRRTRAFLVSTNPLGLRGPEPSSRGPRVLAVGDSVTFGWGVADEEAWPARLSALLGLEVLNAGVPAQRPDAIAAWTAANAPQLDVDLVLFTRRPDPREADPVGRYAEAVRRVVAALPGTPVGVVLPPVSTFDPDGVRRAGEEARALAEALAPVPVLDLTPAFRAALPRPGIVLELEGATQRVLRLPGRGILLEVEFSGRGLSPQVTALFEARTDLAEPLFFDGGHPDAEGFQIFAEAVAGWVRDQGWLGPPATEGAAPIIPAHQPHWERDPPPFVDDPAFYGEASWDDVRGRLVQHQATAWRDLARLRARAGDLAGAADRYAQAVSWMRAHPVATGTGAALHGLYLEALERDAALTRALAEGRSPPLPASGLARLRARLLAGASRAELEAEPLALPSLDRADFQDFEDRHALRLALVRAALDAADPFALPDLWGPWEPAWRDRVAEAILASADGPADLPRHLRPARHLPRQEARFTAEGLGALPTGDSWVDTAGEPGPAAIGRLEALSLEDPTHRAWLESEAVRLQAVLESDPRQVAEALSPLLARLDATPYTSRYYNLKQARNEAVRQLARAGATAEAAALLGAAFPLHRQDFACPNRAGILRGIQGRLLGHAGSPEAEATLRQALAEGDAFLARIDAADRRPR